ncbi:MAG: hypothetical protein ACOZNI_28110 [Myxococcota bacterium]
MSLGEHVEHDASPVVFARRLPGSLEVRDDSQADLQELRIVRWRREVEQVDDRPSKLIILGSHYFLFCGRNWLTAAFKSE